MSILLALIILCLLLAIGLPVALSLALAGAFGLWMHSGLDTLLGILVSGPGSAISSYELMTIPMFLLMAEFMTVSGIANSLFGAFAAWTGRMRGGLGVATAVTGAAFGAISGSSTAAAATLSSCSLPSMMLRGYRSDFAAGIVAISGTLAMLIPPSIAVIFYGLLSGADIGKLLIAGIIPGALVTLTIALTIRFLLLRNPGLAPSGTGSTWREKVASLRVAGPFLALFAMVTGFIFTGVATPVESSALGAIGALLLTIAYGRLDLRTLRTSLVNTCITSAMIGLIIVCAQIFGFFLTLTGATQGLIRWVSSSEFSPYTVLAVLIVLYLVLGCFLDQLSILILTVPVVHPLVVSMGFDSIWFGIMIILLAEVGMVTPPVGMNVFIVARANRMPVTDVFRGVAPHVVAHLVLILVFVLFPQLITWLPGRMQD